MFLINDIVKKGVLHIWVLVYASLCIRLQNEGLTILTKKTVSEFYL